MTTISVLAIIVSSLVLAVACVTIVLNARVSTQLLGKVDQSVENFYQHVLQYGIPIRVHSMNGQGDFSVRLKLEPENVEQCVYMSAPHIGSDIVSRNSVQFAKPTKPSPRINEPIDQHLIAAFQPQAHNGYGSQQSVFYPQQPQQPQQPMQYPQQQHDPAMAYVQQQARSTQEIAVQELLQQIARDPEKLAAFTASMNQQAMQSSTVKHPEKPSSQAAQAITPVVAIAAGADGVTAVRG